MMEVKTMKMIKLFSKLVLFSLSAVVLILNVPVLYAADSCSEGYQIGSSAKTVDCFNPCKAALTSGQTLFVPTKTQAEWDAFRSHYPSGVTLNMCYDVILNSATGASCNNYCASQEKSWWKCVSVGTDSSGTNNRMKLNAFCFEASLITCDIPMAPNGASCGGIATQWTYCRCQGE